MTIRHPSSRRRLPVLVVLGSALLMLVACTVPDAPDARTDDGSTAAESEVGQEPESGRERDDAADAHPPETGNPEWQALADEYAEALAAAGNDPQATQDDLLERIVLAGVELLPSAMPLPDLSYLGTVGVDPTLRGCAANFQIDVGMYELDGGGIPRPYSFDRATTLMEDGFSSAGWSVLERVDMYPESHSFHGQVQGTQYVVDADGQQWRVWISVSDVFGSSSAMYCPAQ